MAKIKHTHIILILVFALGIILNSHYINEFPSHTHAWAQADRYALSLGFVDNGLNFFKPQTFVLNHQFPDNWKVPSNSSITSVDFPIHDYIPAVFMKLSSTKAVWIFRLYVFIYSIIGLLFLYKTALLITNSAYKSVFITVFTATAPVFVHYQASLLPTIPSLANAMIGLYFYLRYLLKDANKDYNISMVFLSLAALSRTTFAIPLIAVFGIEFLRWLFNDTDLKKKLIPSILSVTTLITYFTYNLFLFNKNGSIFLNHPIPAKSFPEAMEILKVVYNRWLVEYFSILHYLIAAVILVLFFIFRKKVIVPFNARFLKLFIATYLLGCVLFSILMLRQFTNHDYYFLDTFFLPLILLLIISTLYLPKIKTLKIQILTAFIILFFVVISTINASISQKKRHTSAYWDTVATTINAFEGSEKFIDNLGINKNSKILVWGSPTPNIPFILMNRKGYVVMSTTKENLINSLGWNFDYLAIQNEIFLSDIYSTYPEVLSRIEKVADNGKISICKALDNDSLQSLSHFLGFDKKKAVFSRMISFEDTISNEWANVRITSEKAYSGKNSGYVSPEMDFGITFKSKNIDFLRRTNRTLLLSSFFLVKDTPNDCELVVSIQSDEKNIYYKTYNLEYILKNVNQWEKIDLLFQLPKIESKNYEFAVYIWNKGKNKLYLDDFIFNVY